MRSMVYDALILRLTSRWYAEVLSRIPAGAQVLDVGIGTAGALVANADRLGRMGLQVTGIDIDADYVRRARRRVRSSGLKDRVAVRLESVYDHRGGPYDAVYFAASFMLLPEPARALWHARWLLKPGGRLYFTQTLQQHPSRWMEVLKPMLKRFTSIDFGRVTYADDFRAEITAAGLELETFTILARHGGRASCLAVARPRAGSSEPAGNAALRAAAEPNGAAMDTGSVPTGPAGD